MARAAAELALIEQRTASWDELLAALEQGVCVVTANTRLAGTLRQAHEQRALGKGRDVWATPDVSPWSAWVRSTWEEAVVAGILDTPQRLLAPQQELHLWEEIVRAGTAERPLLQVAGTARQALEAWRLLQSWGIPLDEGVFRYNADSAAFREWALRFESLCAQRSWLPGARLSDELCRGVRARGWIPASRLVVTGFDELVPQQQRLLRALAEAGCDVRWLQPEGKRGVAVRTACPDARREAATAARWARRRLEEDPAVRIGMVVPELAAWRDIMAHALDEILVPVALSPGRHAVERPYNISLGRPLSHYPVIGTALRILALLGWTIRLEEAGSLLRSPFIAGWEEEACARALLDRHLREVGEPEVSPGMLRYHAGQSGRPHACPMLAARLDAWSGMVRDYPRRGTPVQWSERFANLLKVFGWAGGRPLSSEEHQAMEAWRETLHLFASLEPVVETMSALDAVDQLRRMAGERIFQPRSGAAAVQVMGMLEAIGLPFDQLWVMGLHDGAWPAPPRPNPFIPLPLQRATGLPHASEERELQVAHAITARLLSGAAEVIVSYPRHSGDEDLRPSPLITNLPPVDERDLRLWEGGTWRDRVHASARLAPVGEDPAPPAQGVEVHGGSEIFKYQAACPFRAFAELRLHARPLGQAGIGLDPRARGSLMHRVLEKVWDALDSRERLLAMDAAHLGELVDDAVEAAIGEMAKRFPRTFTRRFRLIEAERLRRQVLGWLALEKQRAPFRVIEREGTHRVTAGGIPVRVKIDRIDELPDGRRLVIDYKTGDVQAGQWFGERPDEPQLPLYSMAAGGKVAGVLFGQVKAGNMAFKGVVEARGLAPGVEAYQGLKYTRDAPSWQAVLDAWRSVLENLGEAFRRGEAAVDPKDYPRTCTFCECPALCRITELTVLDGGDSGTEDQE